MNERRAEMVHDELAQIMALPPSPDRFEGMLRYSEDVSNPLVRRRNIAGILTVELGQYPDIVRNRPDIERRALEAFETRSAPEAT